MIPAPKLLKGAVALLAAAVSGTYLVYLEVERGRAVEQAPKAWSKPEIEHSETLRIGWTAWADAEVVTALTKRLIEQRFGIPVKLVMTDIGVQYQGVSTGSIDLMMMAWLPKTHRPYYEKVAADVLDLGPIYTGARLGWAVPAYVPEAKLRSIEDLRRPDVRRRLHGRIQGIDPGAGLMAASEEALSAYDLARYELVSASGAAMTAALQRAIRSRGWIVVTAWSPHWMFARWQLRYLEDPRGVFGGPESVHVLARRGFAEDYPVELMAFLSRMELRLDELEAMMLDASESSVSEAVDRYIAQHPDRVEYWITGGL